MAKETPAPGSSEPEAAKSATKSFSTMKLIQIGVPIFVVQAVAVYFLTAKFIMPGAPASDTGPKKESTESVREQGEKHEESEGGQEGAAEEQHIYVVKDMIINPAGTNGTRFLLTTIGISVSTQGAEKELEQKEMEVRDALNTVLASKGLAELTDSSLRDSLRSEISGRVAMMLKGGSLRNVYFSKFIVQ
jgi:flagellar protein FliL